MTAQHTDPETIDIQLPGAEVDAEGTEQPQAPAVEGEQPDAEQEAEGTEQVDEDGDTFPRAYVEKLRKENAEARTRAGRADELAGALWEARVAATGRLADPTDLVMPEGADPLDAEAIDAALEDLLARKPHLGSRVPRGNIGQGATAAPDEANLAGLLQRLA